MVLVLECGHRMPLARRTQDQQWSQCRHCKPESGVWVSAPSRGQSQREVGVIPFEFEIPIKVVPGDNERDAHWGQRHERVAKVRAATALCWRNAKNSGVAKIPPLPIVVTFTRIAPDALDGLDNLNSSMKAVRDQVASELGLKSDRVPEVKWRYSQHRRGVREYAVHVRVDAAADAKPEPEVVDPLRSAVLAEREACAKVVEDFYQDDGGDNRMVGEIAARIRARTEEGR